jgi:monoterpene epsilon-lactone hydrolase
VTSVEHEEMVARIVAGGLRTPEELPSAETFRAMREAERSSPLTPVDGFVLAWTGAGGVPLLSVTPEGRQPVGTVVYFHGGGYLWMTPQTHVPVMVAVSRATGARCVGVHYRRAPEHPFPAAVDDAVTAYRSLLDEGNAPDTMAFVGDSAGGGLVLAALVALRDQGIALPAAAVCFSPWTDLAVGGASADSADDPVVSGDALRMMAGAYLGGSDPTSALASPLYADLTGLPPLQIQVGSRESLLDDARRLAERGRQAGVDVTYIEHPGVIHMWIVFGPEIPESEAAFSLLGAFLARHLRAGGPGSRQVG